MTDMHLQTTSGESTPTTDGTGVADQSGRTLMETNALTADASHSSASVFTTPFLRTNPCECGAAWIPCDKCLEVFNDGFK